MKLISINKLIFLGLLVVLALGIFFRFSNLDYKVYWHDETFTTLRISGYTAAEFYQNIYTGNVVSVEDIQRYQQTNSEKSLFDTVNSLVKEDPQHPPLYFLIARFWMQWFGNSVTVVRSISAVISLLALPCVYWLCRELFGKPIVGWVAVLMFSVSPLHLLFAQEAREYSLWMVTILLSSAALLRAIRVGNKLGWGIYALTLVLGFYTFLFTGLVAIAHGIYIAVTEGFRLTKTVIAYVLASVASLIIFAPWLLVVVTNVNYINDATDWAADGKGTLFLLKIWIINITHIFLDVKFTFYNPLTYLIPLILIVVSYAIYFLVRQAPLRVWLFIITLICTTSFPVLLLDIISGGWRSGVPRYMIPCYLGIQLAVAYLIATKISAFSTKTWQHKLWQIVAVLIISSDVISCVFISQTQTWWNKYENIYNPPIADIVNQETTPLIVSDSGMGDIISLSYLLEPKVKFQLVVKPNIPDIPDGFSEVFLFNPSKELLSGIQQSHQIKRLKQQRSQSLWKLN